MNISKEGRYATLNGFSRRNPSLLIYTLAIAAGFLLAFDDLLPGNRLGGSLLSSVGWVPLIILFYLLQKTPGELEILRIAKYFFFFAVMTSLVTSYIFPLHSKGENILIKACKVATDIIIFFYCFRTGYRIQAKASSLLTLIGFVVLLVSFGGIYLSISGQTPFLDTNFFHSTPNLAYRLRGFSLESSTLASILVGGQFLLFFNSRRKFTILYWLILNLGLISLIPSRGFDVSFFVTLFLSILLVVRKFLPGSDSRGMSYFLLTFYLAISFFLGKVLTFSSWAPLRRATSDATRSVWSALSLDSLFSYPAGCGFESAITCTLNQLPQTLARSSQTFSIQALQELQGLYYQNTDFAISPKTFFNLVAVYFGWPGVVLLSYLLFKNINNLFMSIKEGHLLRWITGTNLIVFSLTTYSGVTSWILALGFGALLGTGLVGEKVR